MSGDLDVRAEGALVLPSHGPGRPLGQRRRPQLRLSMGYQDEARGGAPVKTDYFIPNGDDRAVTKFMQVYGDRPRAVNVRLPGSLEGFLELRHVAFAGGFLRAAGAQNFTRLGRLGGADVLTVFEKVGEGKDARLEVREVPISGVNDPAAIELGVYLQMLVSFGIPDVLGFGGLAQIATRGKESIDTLWETAVDVYGQLGSYAMVAVRPKLVLKPSTMLTPTGSRAPLYVLDLWLPESLDEAQAKLREHLELVAPRGTTALALMYGESGSGDIGEPSAATGGPDKPATPTGAVSDGRSLSGESPSPPGPLPPEDEGAGWPDEEQLASWGDGPADDWNDLGPTPDPSDFMQPPASRMTVAEAGAHAFPPSSRKFGGVPLVDLALTEEGRSYLKWAREHWREPPEFVEALRVFVEGLN